MIAKGDFKNDKTKPQEAAPVYAGTTSMSCQF
jgi:hypothetical protein